jgi:tetratricopeptide (TPR) repeat protein
MESGMDQNGRRYNLGNYFFAGVVTMISFFLCLPCAADKLKLKSSGAILDDIQILDETDEQHVHFRTRNQGLGKYPFDSVIIIEWPGYTNAVELLEKGRKLMDEGAVAVAAKEYVSAVEKYEEAERTLLAIRKQSRQYDKALEPIRLCRKALTTARELAKMQGLYAEHKALMAQAIESLRDGDLVAASEQLRDARTRLLNVTRAPFESDVREQMTRLDQLIRHLQVIVPLAETVDMLAKAPLDLAESEELEAWRTEAMRAIATLAKVAEAPPDIVSAAKAMARKLEPLLPQIDKTIELRMQADKELDLSVELVTMAEQARADQQFADARTQLGRAQRILDDLDGLSPKQLGRRDNLIERMAKETESIVEAERERRKHQGQLRALEELEQMRQSALALIDQGEFANALALYDKADQEIAMLSADVVQELQPRLDSIRVALSRDATNAREKLNEKRIAAGWIKIAGSSELVQPTPENMVNAMAAELALGDFARAEDWYVKIKTDTNASTFLRGAEALVAPVLLEWGKLLANQQQYAQAIDKFNLLIEQYPNSRLSSEAAAGKLRCDEAIRQVLRTAQRQRAVQAAPYVIGAVVLVIGMCITWRLPSVVQWRNWTSIRRAEPKMDARPERVRRICQRVSERLGRLAGHRKLNSAGIKAQALAEVLLAILDNRSGLVQQGLSRLDRVRQLFPDGVQQRRWLLKYYAATGRVSGEAVQSYIEFCQAKDQARIPLLRERVLEHLRSACEVRAGADRADIRDRLNWNQAACKVFPEQPWPQLGVGQAQYRLGDLEQARRTLEPLVKQHPDVWAARACLARVYTALGKSDRAQRELSELASARSDDPEVMLEVAGQRAAQGQLHEAGELLNRLTDAPSAIKARAAALRAKVAMRFGRTEFAVTALEKAHAAQPDDLHLTLTLAEAYGRMGDDARALALLEQAIDPNTADPDLQFTMASALLNVNQYGKAAPWLERCSHLNHRPRQVPILRARCMIEAGQYDAAISVLRSAQELSRESADVAFLLGVALYKRGSPKEALRYFARAGASQPKEDRVLAFRARANACACLHRIGNSHVRARRFLEAAQTFTSLRKNLKPAHPDYRCVTQAISECYVRAGLLFIGDRQLDRAREAIIALERAHTLGMRPVARLLLAGLYCHEKKYDKALPVYDEMLREMPDSESLRFARALAASRTQDQQWALQELKSISSQPGRYNLRAALAIAGKEAESKQFDRAAEILSSAARSPAAAQNRYYGETCCRTVLYSIRAGKTDRAKQLATELLAEGNPEFADVVVGALLVDDRDFVAALPYLEAGIRNDGKRTSHTMFLKQVYKRVANQQCENKEFGKAMDTLQRALGRDADRELRQFMKLTEAACNNTGTQLIDEKVIKLLDDLYASSSEPDAMLIRSVAVAHHRRAFDLTESGRYAPALQHWERAHQLWTTQVRRSSRFWCEFIESYNAGQQYKLENDAAKLEQRLAKQFAALSVVVAGKLLAEFRFADARRFWQQACELAGKETALEVFKEVADVNSMIARLDIKANPEQAYELLKFLYDNVDPNPQYKNNLEILSLNVAQQHLKSGDIKKFLARAYEAGEQHKETAANIAFAEALELLKKKDIARFLEIMDVVALLKPDFADMVEKVRDVRQNLIASIIEHCLSNALITILGATRPEIVGPILYQLLGAVAQINAMPDVGTITLVGNQLTARSRGNPNGTYSWDLNDLIAKIIQAISGAS